MTYFEHIQLFTHIIKLFIAWNINLTFINEKVFFKKIIFMFYKILVKLEFKIDFFSIETILIIIYKTIKIKFDIFC